MEKVLIVIKEHRVEVTFDAQFFDSQWAQWLGKLQQLTLLYQSAPEVFFHFPLLPIERIIQCLHEVKNKVSVIGFTTKEESKNNFQILHHRLRGGQPVSIENGALIVGNLEKDVTLVLEKGDLYVMGTIRGAVLCKDEKSRIFCQRMEEARINYAGIWQISTEYGNPVLYDRFSGKRIKEERLWDEVF